MRPTYSFSESIVETAGRERYQHPDPRVQERMEILLLKSKKETNERIAELANVSRSTVQRTLRIYAAKGARRIRSFGYKRQPKRADPAHSDEIEVEFRWAPRRTRSTKRRGGSRN